MCACLIESSLDSKPKKTEEIGEANLFSVYLPLKTFVMCMMWYSRLFTLKNVRTNIYFELTHTPNNTSTTI